ncbi:MAG: hypothetical protein A2600_13435 [Candidatus Lambdaproteobacteria bacterium RIFOXYD1_FULL_56_27]|uniref:Uncharacterized protein n=1 Tax=Candidatus Lambdaproteobacteria bacterium RIFOXYD2_FULL_56_26 TaxID=1817773 RepID=A0A1F6GP64_9PROT|nr:MAG: hypothetical protein A2557_11580 [Candidatus Lambdaproteobacteria bacterium RIFOXYD2_FULL_56_26]OGH03874.1 MAG: hypothetical protein A2426_09075 [Candidatus Lambdaproteobacteria bacterium RIFOXYC1_FULL_56_13]OGH08919.1 MAG: hypothetical protein A2600_13435 [Candidatus Lambdaproteobacteria bacterium RIFOXYD1_FULL_56_27]
MGHQSGQSVPGSLGKRKLQSSWVYSCRQLGFALFPPQFTRVALGAKGRSRGKKDLRPLG